MGWRERDYHKHTWDEPGYGGRGFRWPAPAARGLIFAHVAAFVLVLLIGSEGGEPIAAAAALSAEHAHPVGILTHPFGTQDALTLIITGLVIWILGTRIEQQFGVRKLLRWYVSGNILAGLAFFAVANLWPSGATFELDYPIGAFTAWCVGAYRGVGGEMVPVFGKLRKVSHVLGVGAAILIGLMLALRGLGAIGWLIALGVGGLGQPLADNLPRLRRAKRLRRESAPQRPPPPARRPRPEPQDVDIDDILAKISRQGINSLTDDERERLEAARRAKLGR